MMWTKEDNRDCGDCDDDWRRDDDDYDERDDETMVWVRSRTVSQQQH